MLTRKNILLLILVSLIALYTSAGKIYKWIDKEGKTHYGDQPTKGSPIEEVEIKPGPSEETIRQSREREEKLRQLLKRKEEIKEEVSEIEQIDLTQGWTDNCFSNPPDNLGEDTVNIYESISPRSITPEEHNKLSDMFKMLVGGRTGRWNGNIEEVLCFGTVNSPRIETRQYEIELKVDLNSDNILMIEADLESTDLHIVKREYFWFLLKKDWLRFGNLNTSNKDHQEWDIELISIDKNSLQFLRKFPMKTEEGGILRFFELRSINTSSRSFFIKEWIYINGFLDTIRTWSVKK